MFRKFENINEEQLATNIIAKIDQGERWIFQELGLMMIFVFKRIK